MKLIFAPDSFKGTLTALQVCDILTEAAHTVIPEAETVSIPLADGGEGTLDALLPSMGGTLVPTEVEDPLGRRLKTCYLRSGDTAVIETAKACGYALLGDRERDPMTASTYGVGMQARHAAEAGAKHIMIGLGGSAANDGGMGFLTALGAVFRDERGNLLKGSGAELAKVASAELGGLVKGVRFTAVADVTNPLTGIEGATYVYGPQKGVTDEMKPMLDAAMAHYADVLESALRRGIRDIPGAGAAGGLGAVVAGVLDGDMRPGTECVFEAARFDEKLKDASLVITGEGRCDGQSVHYGKAPIRVYEKAHAAGVGTVLITGSVGPGGEALDALDGLSVMTTVNGVMTLDNALKNAEPLMKSACVRLMKLIKMGHMI